MSLGTAFGRAASFVKRRPDAFALVVALLAAVQALNAPRFVLRGQAANLVGSLLSMFVAPFLTIPVLSLVYADAERDDRVPLSAAFETYGERVLHLLGANLAILGLVVAATFALVVLAFIPVLNVVALITFVFGVLVALFVLQFVSAAVVVDNVGGANALRESKEFVSENTDGAVAFAVARLAVTLPPALAFLFLADAYPRDAALTLTPGALVAAALTVLASAFMHVVYIHYYRDAKRSPY
ncbi:hypothetical protein U3A55_12215 [Salarchaeum sp. III]|uniref:DUF7847 domain-containing protein n=1 Tax=Salarchaeum sp. III TaxID=3107927 RepID=UPI002ED7F461